MKKDLDLHLSIEDRACLQLLWKWKMLSSAALHLAAYPHRSIEGAYKRLKKLEHLKIIKTTAANTGDSYIWHLENLGFQLVLKMLPELAEVGYKSENKEHDFWVTAIHLGEWLAQIPSDCDIFSEQQLRRMHRDQYPKWVPKSTEHRPDGWWKVGIDKPNNQSLIALEVELSRKSPIEYHSVGEFYSTTVLPLQVIWVVRSESDINYIQRHLLSGSKSNSEEQSFLSLSHYAKDQWQAKILWGKNQGRSLTSILCPSPAPSFPFGESLVLLDTRKKPINPISPNKVHTFEEGRSSSYLF